MEVKDLIKNRRLELRLTLSDVAKFVGVNEGTVSRWESGDISNMRRDKIALLSKILQISPLAIMGFDDADVDLLARNGISNSQLYKMAGNSIAVNMLEFLFCQIFDSENKIWV